MDDVKNKILKIIQEEYGFIPLEESILILSELISGIMKAHLEEQPPPEEHEIEVEILPAQKADIEEIRKEKPAIDREEYWLAEKIQHEQEQQLSDNHFNQKSKKKKQKPAIEKYDIDRLEGDFNELF